MAFPVGSHNLFITRPDFVYNEPALYDRDTMGVARFYEEILNSNPESAQSEEMIYVKAQIAVSYRLLGATGSAIEIAQEIQAQLSDMDIRDSKFDSMLDSWEATLQEEAVKAAASEVTAKTFQAWKPTKDHPFPNHLTIPTGHERLKSRWQSMFFHGSEKFDALLSAQDLIRRGVAKGVIEADYRSGIKKPDVIKSILNDTLAAYDIIDRLVKSTDALTSDKISEVHSRLMQTARFHGLHYVPPGDTRTITCRTVYVDMHDGFGRVKFCPYRLVNKELLEICKSVKAHMSNMHNPFAVASWIHLVLARCHPFDDGNGRVNRLVASIPLLMAGYPPIYISLDQHSVYLQAINEAYKGNHTPFTQCIFAGMEAAIERVEGLKN